MCISDHFTKFALRSKMSTSPGVIINNLPVSWKRNGPMISQELTGSRTGKELGAAFWKVHTSLNKFMIVFKQKTDRDTWVSNIKRGRGNEAAEVVSGSALLSLVSRLEWTFSLVSSSTSTISVGFMISFSVLGLVVAPSTTSLTLA